MSFFTDQGIQEDPFGSPLSTVTESPAAAIATFEPIYTTTESSLSDSQEIILNILSIFSGVLSILGSSLIIFRVWLRRNGKNNAATVVNTLTQQSNRSSSTSFASALTPYDRLLLGLSVSDLIASTTYVLQPFLLPEATSSRVWASGTDATCTLLGTLYQLSFAAIWYNGMLSYYYLLTVRFGVKRAAFERIYEKWIHGGTIGYFALTAIGGAFVSGLYSEFELTQGCWIGEFPDGCETDESLSCSGNIIGWAFGGAPTLIVFLSLVVNNLVIVRHVRRVLIQSDANNDTSTDNNNNTDDTSSHSSSRKSRLSDRQSQVNAQHTREVATQGFLYVGTFFCSYSAGFTIRVLGSVGYTAQQEDQIFGLLVANAILLPMQGFFNAFVFTRPNFVRIKAVYPETSLFWKLRKACLDMDIPTISDVQLASSALRSSAINSHNLDGTSSNKERGPLGIRKCVHSFSRSSAYSSGLAPLEEGDLEEVEEELNEVLDELKEMGYDEAEDSVEPTLSTSSQGKLEDGKRDDDENDGNDEENSVQRQSSFWKHASSDNDNNHHTAEHVTAARDVHGNDPEAAPVGAPATSQDPSSSSTSYWSFRSQEPPPMAAAMNRPSSPKPPSSYTLVTWSGGPPKSPPSSSSSREPHTLRLSDVSSQHHIPSSPLPAQPKSNPDLMMGQSERSMTVRLAMDGSIHDVSRAESL